MDLRGKIAIVTGAGKGIGEATSLALAAAGAAVVLAGVRGESIESVKRAIEERGGVALTVRTDVSKWEDAENMAKVAFEKFGRIDILVNNAGVDKIDEGGHQYTIQDMEDSDWDRILGVNLKGEFHCAKAVMPAMMNQKWGRIVNVSSSLGLTAAFGTAPYCASKAGIINFTKMLARQMGPYNVCVNCVAPGMVLTPMQQYTPRENVEAVARMLPLGRVCEASDIAHVVLFFCSEPLMVTGQTLVVDGGGTMH
jgi:NAD(P)-dependent dehydrogenase (short-subunit alcohol dehydrogenase family)